MFFVRIFLKIKRMTLKKPWNSHPKDGANLSQVCLTIQGIFYFYKSLTIP